MSTRSLLCESACTINSVSSAIQLICALPDSWDFLSVHKEKNECSSLLSGVAVVCVVGGNVVVFESIDSDISAARFPLVECEIEDGGGTDSVSVSRNRVSTFVFSKARRRCPTRDFDAFRSLLLWNQTDHSHGKPQRQSLQVVNDIFQYISHRGCISELECGLAALHILSVSHHNHENLANIFLKGNPDLISEICELAIDKKKPSLGILGLVLNLLEGPENLRILKLMALNREAMWRVLEARLVDCEYGDGATVHLVARLLHRNLDEGWISPRGSWTRHFLNLVGRNTFSGSAKTARVVLSILSLFEIYDDEEATEFFLNRIWEPSLRPMASKLILRKTSDSIQQLGVEQVIHLASARVSPELDLACIKFLVRSILDSSAPLENKSAALRTVLLVATNKNYWWRECESREGDFADGDTIRLEIENSCIDLIFQLSLSESGCASLSLVTPEIIEMVCRDSLRRPVIAAALSKVIEFISQQPLPLWLLGRIITSPHTVSDEALLVSSLEMIRARRSLEEEIASLPEGEVFQLTLLDHLQYGSAELQLSVIDLFIKLAPETAACISQDLISAVSLLAAVSSDRRVNAGAVKLMRVIIEISVDIALRVIRPDATKSESGLHTLCKWMVPHEKCETEAGQCLSHEALSAMVSLVSVPGLLERLYPGELVLILSSCGMEQRIGVCCVATLISHLETSDWPKVSHLGAIPLPDYSGFVTIQGERIFAVLEGVTLKLFGQRSSSDPINELALSPTTDVSYDSNSVTISTTLSPGGNFDLMFQVNQADTARQWCSALAFAKSTVVSVGVETLATSWNDALQTLGTPSSADGGLKRTFSWNLTSVAKSRELDRIDAPPPPIQSVQCPGFPTLLLFAATPRELQYCSESDVELEVKCLEVIQLVTPELPRNSIWIPRIVEASCVAISRGLEFDSVAILASWGNSVLALVADDEYFSSVCLDPSSLAALVELFISAKLRQSATILRIIRLLSSAVCSNLQIQDAFSHHYDRSISKLCSLWTLESTDIDTGVMLIFQRFADAKERLVEEEALEYIIWNLTSTPNRHVALSTLSMIFGHVGDFSELCEAAHSSAKVLFRCLSRMRILLEKGEGSKEAVDTLEEMDKLLHRGARDCEQAALQILDKIVTSSMVPEAAFVESAWGTIASLALVAENREVLKSAAAIILRILQFDIDAFDRDPSIVRVLILLVNCHPQLSVVESSLHFLHSLHLVSRTYNPNSILKTPGIQRLSSVTRGRYFDANFTEKQKQRVVALAKSLVETVYENAESYSCELFDRRIQRSNSDIVDMRRVCNS